MDQLAEIACDLLGIDSADVIKLCLTDDDVVLVVRQGQQYYIPRAELVIPEPAEVIATTEAQAVAHMLGIDITTVTGTGRGGRVLVRDVREATNG